jgi:cobalamin biosynthetic protein CobC
VFGNKDVSLGGIDPRFYERGVRLDVARAIYPQALEPWIDLSTAISPWSYPAPSLAEDDLRRFPGEAALRALGETARAAYRAPRAVEVVPFPGADLGLSILPWLFREPKRVAILAPAHSGHGAAWEAAGHSVSDIASLDRAGKAAILVAVNPSHIDGRVISQADLVAAIQPLKRRDGLLIVDETHADADENCSVLPSVNRLDTTLVLRSLGAFYGAAGVGLGFAFTSHPIAGRLKAALGAWPISALALAFGRAALGDADWKAAQRDRLTEAGGQLEAALAAVVLRPEGAGLFRLAQCSEPVALFTRLAEQGILAKPIRGREALRFGLPRGEDELSRLRQALQAC